MMPLMSTLTGALSIGLDNCAKKAYCFGISSIQEGITYDHSDSGETHRGASFGNR
jgi:hypothetical protein